MLVKLKYMHSIDFLLKKCYTSKGDIMLEEKRMLKTKILGKNEMFFDEIDSTQIKAKQFAEEGVDNGTIVITNNQTNGIGTHDRKWYSSNGKNLIFTMIIYPKCKIDNLKTLTIDIAKIFNKSISNLYNIDLEIKKPNDIVYNKKKMGGILSQITTKGNVIKYLLIGIGFNVNQTEFNDEIKEIATSMKLEFNQEFGIKEILYNFLNDFEKYCIRKNIIEE